MLNHFPVLQVILPLMAAPCCFLLWKLPRACWIVATIVSWICFYISVTLLSWVWSGGDVTYTFGGWEPPWGIEYVIDRVNAMILVIVSGLSAVMLPYSWTSIQKEIEPDKQSLFFTSLLLCLAGLLGIAITAMRLICLYCWKFLLFPPIPWSAWEEIAAR